MRWYEPKCFPGLRVETRGIRIRSDDNCSKLPREFFAEVDELSCGAVGSEHGQCNAGLGSVGNFHGSGIGSHFCLDPAGMRGVDLDRRVFQLSGQVNRVGIERRL